MQSRAAEEPPPAETEAEADGGSTEEEPEHEHQPTATAGVGHVPAEAVDVSTERVSDVNNFTPFADTEQANVEEKTVIAFGPEEAAAAAPAELMEPMGDHELKTAPLSSQSEESIR